MHLPDAGCGVGQRRVEQHQCGVQAADEGQPAGRKQRQPRRYRNA